MKSFKKKLAFTIVEILIVVALIAILASIAMMVGGKGTSESNIELTRSVMALLDSALQEYHAYTGTFPQPPASDNTPLLRSQFLYLALSSIPDSQKILEMIPTEQIQNKQTDAFDNLFEIYDGWGTPLDYIYVSEPPAKRMNFPLIISAGPDKKFYKPTDTSNDDITNKK